MLSVPLYCDSLDTVSILWVWGYAAFKRSHLEHEHNKKRETDSGCWVCSFFYYDFTFNSLFMHCYSLSFYVTWQLYSGVSHLVLLLTFALWVIASYCISMCLWLP